MTHHALNLKIIISEFPRAILIKYGLQIKNSRLFQFYWKCLQFHRGCQGLGEIQEWLISPWLHGHVWNCKPAHHVHAWGSP